MLKKLDCLVYISGIRKDQRCYFYTFLWLKRHEIFKCIIEIFLRTCVKIYRMTKKDRHKQRFCKTSATIPHLRNYSYSFVISYIPFVTPHLMRNPGSIPFFKHKRGAKNGFLNSWFRGWQILSSHPEGTFMYFASWESSILIILIKIGLDPR